MATLQEVMNDNVENCKPQDDLQTLAKAMKTEDVGFLPIANEDGYLGVVTDRDLVVRGLAKGSADQVKAEDIMTENVVTGTPDMQVEEATRLMQDHQIKRLLVVKDQEVKGVVSLGDLGVNEMEKVAGDTVSEIKKGSGNN
ncbi:CBS domain-containing protein [Thalassobacillus cyri]|uniref:CBS domain-containing protein n=1 Tax=Thalassobacillus cyri TaxID=571932 RepID=A0A1H3XX23_9BACI|nr:CBS domain-containing protein [Thalassobacillus cyri]SEA04015.1 CBS domain-containing protein [Thalassobacillus cyri]